MIKRVMNVLTVLAGVTSVLFFWILDYSIQALFITLLILLPAILALNYILFGKLSIWHDGEGG